MSDNEAEKNFTVVQNLREYKLMLVGSSVISNEEPISPVNAEQELATSNVHR